MFFYFGLYLIKYLYLFFEKRALLSKNKGYFYLIMKLMKAKKVLDSLDVVIYFTKSEILTPIYLM
jgi:hypothetical protein